MTGRCRAGVGALLVVFLALAGVAQAKTKTVNMGIPPKSGKAFQKLGVDVDDFFPHGVTIHKGDKVKFLPVGFHSFDFPPRGGAMLSLFAPTGEKVAGVNDAAGQPFWFNGRDQITFNPLLAAGTFGKKLSFNGSKRIISGLPLADKPKPITVTFKKTGKFTYYCNIHAGMKGTVSVKDKGASIPSDKADKKALARQVATALTTSKKLSKVQVPANTVNVGSAGAHGEELFAFVPAALTIPTGTSLTFRMSPKSYDLHTATTGPGNPEADPNSYLGQIAASFQGAAFDPRGVYASEAPGTGGVLTPGLHGNGFWNSGVMDRGSSTVLTPSSNAVRFGGPGKYEFYCLIHPFMHMTVTVQ